MMNQDEAYKWIDRMMDGEDIPRDVEELIDQTPDLREYKIAMHKTLSALESLSIPEPPAGLPDAVMGYIAKCEQELNPSTVPPPSSGFNLWHLCIKSLPTIPIPRILQREAIPAFVTALIVLFGIFISPQVEAGKDFRDLRIVGQVMTYAGRMVEESDKIYSFVDSTASELIDKVTSAFQSKKKIPSQKQAPPEQNDIKNDDTSYENNRNEIRKKMLDFTVM